MTAAATDISTTLRDLAARLERLAPSRRDPERYFVEKDAIIVALKLLASTISRGTSNAK